jgi:hypothetical protein
MGLIANIYRWSLSDCSNGGLSSRVNEVTLVNVEGPFEPNEDRPAALLLNGHSMGTVRVVPAVEVAPGGSYEAEGRPMMGGAYVATSDARFTEAVERLTGAPFYGAVALHDRYEDAATARMVSRD